MGFYLTEPIEDTATETSGGIGRRRSISGRPSRQKNRIGTQSCWVILSSKYLDNETGLYYYGYRYYDPVTGRWLSKDPMEENGGLSLYEFVGNQPISMIDPLGLAISVKTHQVWMNSYSVPNWNVFKIDLVVHQLNYTFTGRDGCCKRVRVTDYNFDFEYDIYQIGYSAHEWKHYDDVYWYFYEPTERYLNSLTGKYYSSAEEVECWRQAAVQLAYRNYYNFQYWTTNNRDLTQWFLKTSEEMQYRALMAQAVINYAAKQKAFDEKVAECKKFCNK